MENESSVMNGSMALDEFSEFKCALPPSHSSHRPSILPTSTSSTSSISSLVFNEGRMCASFQNGRDASNISSSKETKPNVSDCTSVLKPISLDKYSALRELSQNGGLDCSVFSTFDSSQKKSDYFCQDEVKTEAETEEDFGDFQCFRVPTEPNGSNLDNSSRKPDDATISLSACSFWNPTNQETLMPDLWSTCSPPKVNNSLQDCDDFGSFVGFKDLVSKPIREACQCNTISTFNSSSPQTSAAPPVRKNIDEILDFGDFPFVSRTVDTEKCSGSNFSKIHNLFQSSSAQPDSVTHKEDSVSPKHLDLITLAAKNVNDGDVDSLNLGQFDSQTLSLKNEPCLDMIFQSDKFSSVNSSHFGDSNSLSSLNFTSIEADDAILSSCTPGSSAGFDFETESEKDRWTYEWRRCVPKCTNVISVAIGAFRQASSSSTIHQLISSDQGRSYVLNVTRVYLMAKRIECSMERLSVADHSLDAYFDNLHDCWDTFCQILLGQPFLEEIKSIIYENGHSTGGKDRCGVCLGSLSPAPESEKLHLSAIDYGGKFYHVSCANFWINEVDYILPCLS